MPGEFRRTIHDAVKKGNIEEVQRMVKNGASINEVDEKEKFTPLHWACAVGALEVTHWLLWQRADPTVQSPRGWTPAHICAIKAQDACLQALINNGVGLSCKDLRGSTTAHLAAAHGNSFCLQTILRAGVEVEATDKNGWTAVHLAAYHGRLGCVQILAKWGSRVDDVDGQGNTAAHLAAQEGHLPVLKYLVACGPSSTHVLSARNDQGETPKMLAQQFYKTPIVEYIAHIEWERDCPEEVETLSFPAHLAAGRGDLDHLRMLVENGVVNVNERDEHGSTPLHKAAGQGQITVLQWLIEMGANQTVQNEAGETARDVARRFAQLGALRILGGDMTEREIDEARPGFDEGDLTDIADPPFGNTEGDGIALTARQIKEAQARAKKKIEELDRLLEIARENYKQLGGKLSDEEKKRLREVRERDRKQLKMIEEQQSQLDYERLKREKLEGQLDEYRREITHLNAQLEQYAAYQPSETTMRVMRKLAKESETDNWGRRPPRRPSAGLGSKGRAGTGGGRRLRPSRSQGRGGDSDGVFVVRRQSLDRSQRY